MIPRMSARATIDEILTSHHSGRAVVNEVSFTVNQGEIVGLLGRNGAGKTTSFRMTIGMIAPNAGEVIFDGVDVTSMPMYKRARRGMGYLSQEPSIFQKLTVRQNILAIMETMNLSRAVRNEKGDRLESLGKVADERDSTEQDKDEPHG